MTQEFFVVPITHVDLVWKRGRAEMSEMLEIVVVRLLDSLENDPDFKYMIEQAAHFRELQKRRPDLIKRLQPFIAQGRLEVVGGMASTLENNLPNGECFVRNQQMGLRWVRETWGAEVKTGWLLDTFGINAQVPQILRGFGFTQLLANRFGGAHNHDLFLARGLDGSEIPVAGWGTYAAHMCRENLSERFCTNWDDIEIVFAQADKLSGPGPFMVIPYTENEMLVSRRPSQLIAERNAQPQSQHWKMATPGEYFDAVTQSGRVLPVVHGDLNPEFTGCFSLRQPIRLRNRAVETRLLEAEKWTALAGVPPSQELEEAWWKLHFVQFHDVFTGSHPTVVFHEVMRLLDEIEAATFRALIPAFEVLTPIPWLKGKNKEFDNALALQAKWDRPQGIDADAECLVTCVFNGLPWLRRDILERPLPFPGVSRVIGADGADWPFEVRGQNVRIAAQVPAVGFRQFHIVRGPKNAETWHEVDNAVIENETIRCEFDTQSGLAKLIWKPTGAVLMENAGNWLVAQRDDGNFQIENPCGAEVAACSGSLRLQTGPESPLGQSVRLSGEFPPLTWAGDGNVLRWNAEFFVPVGRAEVRLKLALAWKGEGTRLRLTLPTTIDSATGIYEIPFGVVSRKPYSPRTNAKGEWPAHRFVAIENNGHGIALANTGVAGVEVSGGTIYTTLLRAPKTVYAGMVADETSSLHGHHDFAFAILPYAGTWSEAGVVRYAQELNNALWTGMGGGPKGANASFLSLEPQNVVLSAIKGAADGSGQIIVRVYETAGQPTEAVLNIPGAGQIWECDMDEQIGDELPSPGGLLRFTLAPFEIKTFRMIHGRITSQ